MYFLTLLGVASVFGPSLANAIPSSRQHDKRQQRDSKSIPGTAIEYQKNDLCETTPGVNSYSGYVHLTSEAIPDLQGNTPFNISTFFWYFEARNNPETAPLAIYLAGGPGEASTYTALSGESGPCYANKDGNSTTLNPWSFNNHVNMLYIDQPNQVGFSYDVIMNGTLSVIDGNIYNQTVPENQTFIPGGFPSQNPETIANTTGLAAKALWHFTQVWLSEFEEYQGPEDTVSVWGNSYGGDWTIGAFIYFQDQNENLANGTLDREKYKMIKLDTLGITNGYIDFEVSARSYVTLPYNNTYGVQLYNETVYNTAMQALEGPGGCLEQIVQCRVLQAEGDPGNIGNNDTVNGVCSNAASYCFENFIYTFPDITGLSGFDISVPTANPLPPLYPAPFLNQEWVRDALGVPQGLNYTTNSNLVQSYFMVTGEYLRRTIADLNSLLDHGVKVALVYGDRDWKCSWIGAENISLQAEYASSGAFRASGYENITTNETYVGGVTRQFEGFSFSRVFDAAHYVSYSQPETVYQIFNRAMFGKDVPTGKVDTMLGSNYSSVGPASSWHIKNVLPEPPVPECSIWDVPASCSADQAAALTNGTAVVENYIVIDPAT